MKTISRIAYNDKRTGQRSTDHDGNLSDHDAACYHQYCGKWVIHLQKSQAAGSYGSNYGLFVFLETDPVVVTRSDAVWK